nr:reverse transcriptase domain-containing protein [Tanacetum cinerariifolium]
MVVAKLSRMTTFGDGGSIAGGSDDSGSIGSGSGCGDGDNDGGGGGGEGDLGLLRDDGGKRNGNREDDDGKIDSGGEEDDGNSDGSSGYQPDKNSTRSDDDSAGLTGKVVISSSESNMMTNDMSTPARGVVAGKGVGQGVVIVEDYDDEREMEPRPETTMETTPPLQPRKDSNAEMGIVVSTIHEAIKFHTAKGIKTVFLTHESNKIKEGIKKLLEHFKEKLQDLLRTNADVFSWTHSDMTGIPRTIMIKGKPFKTEHNLNEYSHIKLIKQKRRGLGPDHNTSACKEVEELAKAGILQKVKHQTWVANTVMLKKSDEGWRMCVDFTSINKACPKDCYPLLEIDWKVESLSGFQLKRFLDAYKGYYQIQMAEKDEDKTTFFAGEGDFCYQNMPFCLKNAKATYQRLVEKDIKGTFERFRSINMKLNPKKCSFGVEEGPFLGHLITKQ